MGHHAALRPTEHASGHQREQEARAVVRYVRRRRRYRALSVANCRSRPNRQLSSDHPRVLPRFMHTPCQRAVRPMRAPFIEHDTLESLEQARARACQTVCESDLTLQRLQHLVSSCLASRAGRQPEVCGQRSSERFRSYADCSVLDGPRHFTSRLASPGGVPPATSAASAANSMTTERRTSQPSRVRAQARPPRPRAARTAPRRLCVSKRARSAQRPRLSTHALIGSTRACSRATPPHARRSHPQPRPRHRGRACTRTHGAVRSSS